MTVKPIAKSYWRLIKAKNRTFDSVPESVVEDVKILAKQDVVEGVITEDVFELLLGEVYEI